MRKIFDTATPVIVVLTLILSACPNSTVPGSVAVSGVSLDRNALALYVGETASLAATVSPDDAANKAVSWSTSDGGVATVDDGRVIAVAAGTATITVTTEDGGKTADCAVTVTVRPTPVSGVSLDRSALALYVGDTATLAATVSPDDQGTVSLQLYIQSHTD
jgi:uncharacterized protein YjdB